MCPRCRLHEHVFRAKHTHRRILVIVDLEVLTQLGIREKIGNPTAFESAPARRLPSPATTEASASSFYGNRPAPPPQRALASGSVGGRGGAPGGGMTGGGQAPRAPVAP